ncbi:peptidase S8 and S53 subtilisin kexin sedolisin [Ammonifex degensii KC4]|uniref:Peptidase S8 and S53 subtilisin kexin sedolisin n=1 Tax=Ammonifex degensii (strain DSM 10501 / KC4) TaxID=429009 RepID=C9RBN7_AMMDK|nr:S8 family serine peptidase [Ammonifex degensii]ACX51664.1 peptidase S8 and S53 subtilisin kexin sedolisin [Ammonifex degensii KC4]
MTSELATKHTRLGLKMARQLPHGAALLKTGADVRQAVAELMSDPRVEYAQPNYIYRIRAISIDPLANWGITNAVYGVQAESAWQYTQGNGIIVAVLDTGVDYNHPDLKDNMWHDPQTGTPGYDFVNNDPYPVDDNGHGTHVAGIIAAELNGQGGVGVAPQAKIMAVKVMNADGWGTSAQIVQGINYAAGHGARIINMSFGCTGCEPDYLEYEAIKSHPDVLFVAAAGNEASNNDQVLTDPASFTVDWAVYNLAALPNVIAVAALADPSRSPGNLASFSNYGPKSVALAAPGEDILSTVPSPPPGGGVALAVYSPSSGYKVMFWGFGAEDLATPEAVYDSIVRVVYNFFGITPADTQTKPLLVVDDDQSESGYFPDVSLFYRNTLSTAGYVYTFYTVPSGADGPAVDATVYSGVIWFTGYAWCSNPNSADPNNPSTWVPNLTANDQNNLTQYLTGGGKLFLCGRYAGYGIENTPFYHNYLGAQFINWWEGPSVVAGVYDPYTGTSYLLNPYNRRASVLAPAIPYARVVLTYQPYEAWSGTSMAAPFVSGAAALALSLRGDLSPGQLINILRSQVTPLPGLSGKVASGGTLNAYNVVNYVRSLPAPGGGTGGSSGAGGGGGGGGSGGGGGGGGGAPAKKEEMPPGVAELVATGDKQQLSLPEGKASLEIPAGALPPGTKLVVRIAAEAPENLPAGLLAAGPVINIESDAQPARPVKVALAFDPAKLGNLSPFYCLAFRQEADGSWRPVGGRLDFANSRVVVELEHFSSYAVLAVRKEFPDVAGHWAAKDIAVLAARGVVGGYPDGTFRPDKAITRAELAAMICRLLGLEAETPPHFSDVPPGAWYAKAVAAVSQKGLMVGDGDRFRPEDTLTREELAAVALRLAGILQRQMTPNFRDAEEISPWARQAVATAAAAGLVYGVGEGKFAPQQEVTRAQMAAILYRVAQRLGLWVETVTLKGQLTWSTIEKPHWELVAGQDIYVLLPDQADTLTAQALRESEGKEVTVKGYLESGPNIYMRGKLLRLISIEPAQ